MNRIARCLIALALSGLPLAAAAGCPPEGQDRASLLALKADGFALADDRSRQALALSLLACLADPDPALRDGVAYEGLSTWLRADALDAATRQSLLDGLLPMLQPDARDTDGFAAPFAALVLSEVARTDRIAAWMAPAQRAALVEAASGYVEGVRDYRGFHPTQGWRHGVAHGADLLMQLALNPALDKSQLDRLLAAAGSQVAPSTHAYVHGESERLVRPVLFVLQRGQPDQAEWSAWIARISAPAPMVSWSEAFGSEAGLARRHNLRLFLFALLAALRESDSAALQARVPPVLAALRSE
jgi:hypothetical protein